MSSPTSNPGDRGAGSGLIFNVQRFSIHDGPGIRTTVFLKGCPLDCVWCHNPEGIGSDPEILALGGRCIECGGCLEVCPRGVPVPAARASEEDRGACTVCGACVEFCPTGAREIAGRWVEAGELVDELARDRIFFEQSGGGVTFSGGEPLSQPSFLLAVLEACRSRGIRTAIDTCGLAPRATLLAAAALSDLVLYDLKSMDDATHRRYTGVSNRPILDNLQALGRRHGAVWVRIPVIPGINDAEADLEAAARFAASIPGVRKVCLLPYHRIGEDKRRRLGRAASPTDLRSPSSKRMGELAALVQSAGVRATVGG